MMDQISEENTRSKERKEPEERDRKNVVITNKGNMNGKCEIKVLACDQKD